jgi:hypothetical protein
MRRRAFLVLGILLVPLCVATALLWARTFFVRDDLHVGRWEQSGQWYDDLHIRCGGQFLEVDLSRATPGMAAKVPGARGAGGVGGIRWTYERHAPTDQGLWSWVWWDHYVDVQPIGTAECWRIQLRPWLPMLASMLLILAWWEWRAVARRRADRSAGRCVVCGYDVRATPERCPECGTPVALRSSAPASPGVSTDTTG